MVVDAERSDEKALYVALSPCSCSSRWVRLPTMLISDVKDEGVEACCGSLRRRILVTFFSPAADLVPLIREYASTMGVADYSALSDTNAIRRDTVINVVWQWNNNSASMLSALNSYSSSRVADALAALKSRQSHNPSLQNL
jgi:hypothetical protein